MGCHKKTKIIIESCPEFCTIRRTIPPTSSFNIIELTSVVGSNNNYLESSSDFTYNILTQQYFMWIIEVEGVEIANLGWYDGLSNIFELNNGSIGSTLFLGLNGIDIINYLNTLKYIIISQGDEIKITLKTKNNQGTVSTIKSNEYIITA